MRITPDLLATREHDGSEVIEVIKISNLPAGATLTAGVNNGGVWKTSDYGRVWTPIFDDQPTGSIGDTKPSTTPLSRAEPLSQQASNPATSGQVALDQAGTVTSEDTPPLPALNTLDAPALIQLISERITQQRLLPADDAASAHAAFKTLETRFAGHPGIIDARIQLKDAHLKQSDQARSQGQWEAAQQHLDAAFEVLQPDATQSLSATAPSNGS